MYDITKCNPPISNGYFGEVLLLGVFSIRQFIRSPFSLSPVDHHWYLVEQQLLDPIGWDEGTLYFSIMPQRVRLVTLVLISPCKLDLLFGNYRGRAQGFRCPPPM